MKQIPNLFTLLNLFFGGMAIIFALQTNTVYIFLDQELNSSFNIPEKLAWASICIIIAAVIDFLDGFVARLLKASSELGKQLDSLSDVVSFGVAPAVILYQLLRLSFARGENGLEVSILWLLPALVLACAGAYRLAKFNIATDQQYSFKGVPIPAVGLLVASFPLILHFNEMSSVNSFIMNEWFLYGTIIICSFLMISNLNMLSLKFTNYKFGENKAKYLLVITTLVAAVFLHWVAVPVIFIFYVLLSIITSKKTETK
jgi:CDP-diacylglycerol--serine O-phosphatidyltransferase